MGPSRRDNLERGNLRVPLAMSTPNRYTFEEGSPALGSLVISWRGRIGRLVHARRRAREGVGWPLMFNCDSMLVPLQVQVGEGVF